MAEVIYRTIGDKLRTHLVPEFCKKLGIHRGSIISYELVDDAIIIRKATVVPLGEMSARERCELAVDSTRGLDHKGVAKVQTALAQRVTQIEKQEELE